jgi:2-polyprenyl-3-methyl-5-hydroxy-6-metoxy-1,4-benzoquinol methylase
MNTHTRLEADDQSLFNRISNGYIRKDLLPAHRIARKHRLVQTLNAASLGPDIDILEIGSGAGFAADYLRGLFNRYRGLDYSEKLVAFARRNNNDLRVDYEAVNIHDFRADRAYDAVVAIGVLHHLDQVDSVMKRIVSWIKPEGWLLVNEPQNSNGLVRVLRSIRKRIDSSYSVEQTTYSAQELCRIFHRAGLTSIKTVPQGIFSTPFAEVIMPYQTLMVKMSMIACITDTWLEKIIPSLLSNVTWNVIAAGKRPGLM